MEAIFGPYYPAHSVREAYDEVEDETSVICRSCNKLVNDVEAGRFVLWTKCEDCALPIECQPKKTFWERFFDVMAHIAPFGS